MTYMRAEKIISSREFQQQFAKISKRLQPGQSVAVTNRGVRIGTFTKAQARGKVPDFYANLQKLGHSKSLGQKMIEQIVNDLP
jgi:hypothetical protein